MRRSLVAMLLVLAVAGGWAARRALGEDAAPGAGMPSPEEQKKMMELMEVLARPGEEHKWLAQAEGDWDVTVREFVKPGEAKESKGTATIRMILGGRWQEQVFKGAMEGRAYEGHGWTGYDNEKKQFVNYWIDTMSTGTAPATGQLDAAKKTLTTTGVWEMGGQKMPFRNVLTIKGPDEAVFQMHGTMGGSEILMMELVYKRK